MIFRLQLLKLTCTRTLMYWYWEVNILSKILLQSILVRQYTKILTFTWHRKQCTMYIYFKPWYIFGLFTSSFWWIRVSLNVTKWETFLWHLLLAPITGTCYWHLLLNLKVQITVVKYSQQAISVFMYNFSKVLKQVKITMK
jgi:apolipoprotein N-acyltransferase